MVDFTLPPEVVQVRDATRGFVEEVVLPAEADAFEPDGKVDWKLVESLRVEARERGLWAPHLPEAWGGLGLGAVALAMVHGEAGASLLGPLALNCMAPDEGNMHALLHFGTDEQRERYLRPLAEGRVRSCFAMTEKGAGSDPSRLTTVAERDGDDWVLHGEKWFISGASGAAFAIVVALTDPERGAKEGSTLFLVDTDRPGWEVVRDIPAMGTHLPGGHCEVRLDGVRVPTENVLGELGQGLSHAQARLGLGRVTHAMRWIGTAQRALDLATGRAIEREVFGKALAKHQAIQWMLADSARELYLARLAVLHCAWRIDEGLDHRHEVSMLKNFGAKVLHDVVDRAIQVHGALGYSMDLPLERFYRDARAARLYDGADEVHQWVVARNVVRSFEEHGTTRSTTGGAL